MQSEQIIQRSIDVILQFLDISDLEGTTLRWGWAMTDHHCALLSPIMVALTSSIRVGSIAPNRIYVRLSSALSQEC